MSTLGNNLLAQYYAQQNNGYVRDGLVFWLDGIDNTRHGHDATTQLWEDLSGYGHDMHFYNGTMTWRDDCLVFPGGTSNTNIIQTSTLFGIADDYTLEVCFQRTTIDQYASCFSSVESGGTGWQCNAQGERPVIGNPSGGYYPLLNSYDTSLERHAKSLVANMASQSVRQYINNMGTDVVNNYNGTRYGAWGFCIGTDANDNLPMTGFICAVRVYSRSLSDKELTHNYNIDRKRFNF